MSQVLEARPIKPYSQLDILPESNERRLTVKQQKFVKYYVQTGNGQESARLAGYSGDDNGLRSIASETLTLPNVKAAIARLLNPIADAEEVLSRLTRYSRADITDVLSDSGSFSVQSARENGTSDLIKSVKYDKEGNLSGLEIHDAHEATRDLARIHGLFIDRTQSETLNLHIHASADDRAGKLAELISRVGQRALPASTGQNDSTDIIPPQGPKQG